jgi:hypothetical protein
MNDVNRTSAPPDRHPGRLYLLVGLLAALAGPAMYAGQLSQRILIAPWYVPLLATGGLLLIFLALVRSRSIWRWTAALLVGLAAAGEWAMILILMAAPAYTGPAKAGQPFPEFATTLADGSTFDNKSLKGDKNTAMVFFRGRW